MYCMIPAVWVTTQALPCGSTAMRLPFPGTCTQALFTLLKRSLVVPTTQTVPSAPMPMSLASPKTASHAVPFHLKILPAELATQALPCGSTAMQTAAPGIGFQPPSYLKMGWSTTPFELLTIQTEPSAPTLMSLAMPPMVSQVCAKVLEEKQPSHAKKVTARRMKFVRFMFKKCFEDDSATGGGGN